MKLTEAQLKEIWQRQTAHAAPHQPECLTEEQFEHALTGEMSAQQRAQMADHLAACSDCVEEYRTLRSLRPLAEEAEALLTASAAPRTVQNLRAVKRAGARPAALRPRFAALFSPARLLAASVTLISIALGLWLVLLHQGNDREIARLNRELAEREQALASVKESLDETRKQFEESIRRSEQEKSGGDSKQIEVEIAELRQTIAELSRPQLDVPIVDLDPSSPTRGNTAGDEQRVEVPPTANFITLILNITGQPRHSSYEVEIFDSNGRQAWRGVRAGKGRDHSVNLTLARRMLPAGRYLIKLHGLRDGKRETVADYPLMISYQ
ncbi:MAG TPA: hypothetical protein VJ810_15380 [Blastocatellia bacterium]|nr:hypothetical protein [Blastocatellia bacterium]